MGDMNRVIEGPCASEGWTKLTALGSKTINHLVVPDGVHSIDEIRVTATALVQTDAKGCLLGISLRGGAIPNTPYDFLAGGMTMGKITTSGARGVHMRPFLKQCGVAVKPGQPLEVWGSMITDSDCGTVEFQVEVSWSKAGGKKRYSEIRYAVCAALDTEYNMTLDGESDTVNDFDWPADVTKIISYVPAVGGGTLATATGGTAQVELDGGLVDGNQVLTAGGHSALSTTDGAGAWVYETEEIRTNMVVTKQGKTMGIAQMGGVDWGGVFIGISMECE